MQPEPSYPQVQPQPTLPQAPKKFNFLIIVVVLLVLVIIVMGIGGVLLGLKMKSTTDSLNTLQGQYDTLMAENNTISSNLDQANTKLAQTTTALNQATADLETANANLTEARNETAALQANINKALKYLNIMDGYYDDTFAVSESKISATGDATLLRAFQKYENGYDVNDYVTYFNALVSDIINLLK